MSKTKIEWCARPGTHPETWNPTTGCDKVSQGCKNCYAETMHKRLQGMGQKKYDHPFLGTVKTHEDVIALPLKWKTPRTVFVNSMSDLFHKQVPFSFIRKVFHVMEDTPQHTYQILTKRPERMLEFSQCSNSWAPKNVWLGTSVEDQQTADERIPFLLQVPASVRFLSCEPLLGSLNISTYLKPLQCWYTDGSNQGYTLPPVSWVIAGGESGHHARPMHPEWIRSLRDQCRSAVVPFFFKQWGEFLAYEDLGEKGTICAGGFDAVAFSSIEKFDAYGYNNVLFAKVGKHSAGRTLDGREWNEFPKIGEEATA